MTDSEALENKYVEEIERIIKEYYRENEIVKVVMYESFVYPGENCVDFEARVDNRGAHVSIEKSALIKEYKPMDIAKRMIELIDKLADM